MSAAVTSPAIWEDQTAIHIDTATALLGEVTALTYVSTPATVCTVLGPTGDANHYVVLAEDEGFALVQPDGCQGWVHVCIGDLDLNDDDDVEDVLAAVIETAFGPRGDGR
jgi:hypothetical protein